MKNKPHEENEYMKIKCMRGEKSHVQNVKKMWSITREVSKTCLHYISVWERMNLCLSGILPSSVNEDIRNSSITERNTYPSTFLKNNEEIRTSPFLTYYNTHHLLLPVELWRGCCQRLSAPGRCSSLCLLAARPWWSALRWVRRRSGCWVVAAGWETAGSAQTTIRRKVEQLAELGFLWRWGWWKLCYGPGWNYNQLSCSVLNLSVMGHRTLTDMNVIQTSNVTTRPSHDQDHSFKKAFTVTLMSGRHVTQPKSS